MLHCFNVLRPGERTSVEGDQKPFFGLDWRLSRTERDVRYLDGKWPEESRERDSEGLRFVNLLSPPYL